MVVMCVCGGGGGKLTLDPDPDLALADPALTDPAMIPDPVFVRSALDLYHGQVMRDMLEGW